MAATDTLNAREARLVAALASAPSVRVAAERVGLSERTAHRWLAERAHVQAAYREAVRAAAGQAMDALRIGAARAVEYLAEVLADRDSMPNDRRSAATVLLSAYVRVPAELLDHEDRLRSLEAIRGLHVA